MKSPSLMQIAVVAIVVASTASAHGFVIPSPPSPPGTGIGIGGGFGAPGAPGIGGGDGGSTGGGIGGGSGGVGNGGGGDPGDGRGPGLSPPAGFNRPTGGGAPARGGTTPVPRRARKDLGESAELRINWRPAFLPAIGNDRYGMVTANASNLFSAEVTFGGLSRDGRPCLVVFYDPTDRTHLDALAALDSDDRIRTASALFQCFRIDAEAPKRAGAVEPVVAVYGADGALVGKATGLRRNVALRRLMESAFGAKASELGSAAAKVEPLTKLRATLLDRVRFLRAAIACPDCGEFRAEAKTELETLKWRVRECLDALRAVAAG